MSKIKAIVKSPYDTIGYERMIDNTLETFQNLVGGYIETVPLPSGGILIVNEEGKLKDLPHNFNIGMPPHYDYVAGTAVVVGRDGEEFCDCPYDKKTWKWMLEIWGNVV